MHDGWQNRPQSDDLMKKLGVDIASPDAIADLERSVVDLRDEVARLTKVDATTGAPKPRANLRAAAAAVLAAWNDQNNRGTDIVAALEAPMDALRSLRAETAPRVTNAPRKPREGAPSRKRSSPCSAAPRGPALPSSWRPRLGLATLAAPSWPG